MSRAAILLCALVGCASTVPPPMPLRESRLDNLGEHQLIVGQRIRAELTWPCRHPSYAERGPAPVYVYPSEASCRPGMTAVVQCTGAACEAHELESTPSSIAIEEVGHEPGALATSLVVRDATGKHEEFNTIDTVLPPPAPGAGDITCVLRDPQTGAFEPCPDRVAPDRDLFFAVHDADPVARVSFEIYLEGRRIVTNPSRWPRPKPGEVECYPHAPRGTRATVGPLDCTGRPSLGPHTLVAVGHGAAIARYDFVVAE